MSIPDQKLLNEDKPGPPTRPLVQVEWDDSQFAGGWEHETTLNPDYEMPVVYTTGFLVQETDKYLTIAQSMIFYHDVSNQLCGLMTIPRGCIRSIRKIRRGGTYVPRSK